jgi:hypothetical protein
MSQADAADSISAASETPDPRNIADIVFEMEDVLNEGLCLTDALIALTEGRRETLRMKPNTVHFLAYEVQSRFERVHAEWRRLFALTHAGAGG